MTNEHYDSGKAAMAFEAKGPSLNTERPGTRGLY